MGGSTAKWLGWIGSIVGSYAGWYLGAPDGIMTAFMLSMVGMGAGLYLGRRVARDYLE
jgi:hypothetical protein